MKSILYFLIAVSLPGLAQESYPSIQDLNAQSDYTTANWQPVMEAIGDRRIVLLGEFDHGSHEVFTSRNSLIKALHEQLGYSIILFESGIAEMGAIQKTLTERKERALLSGFFGGWRTPEFEELMRYCKEKRIYVGGFDVQRTGQSFTDYYSSISDDAGFAELESGLVNLKQKFGRVPYDSILPTIQNVSEGYKSRFEKAEDDFIRIALNNRLEYLNYMNDFSRNRDWRARWTSRDSSMAANVEWHLNKIPDETKVIIVAHNFHISRFNKEEEVMGEFLMEKYSDEMYVVGVFAGEGSSWNNAHKEEELSAPAGENDMKHIIQKRNVRMGFINFANSYSTWISESIITNDTFVDLSGGNEIVPERCFDGLLLLDRVTPAHDY